MKNDKIGVCDKVLDNVELWSHQTQVSPNLCDSYVPKNDCVTWNFVDPLLSLPLIFIGHMLFITFSTIHCSHLWNLIYFRHIISVFFSIHKKKLKKMQMNVNWHKNWHWSHLNQEMPVQVMVWKQYIVMIMYI